MTAVPAFRMLWQQDITFKTSQSQIARLGLNNNNNNKQLHYYRLGCVSLVKHGFRTCKVMDFIFLLHILIPQTTYHWPSPQTVYNGSEIAPSLNIANKAVPTSLSSAKALICSNLQVQYLASSSGMSTIKKEQMILAGTRQSSANNTFFRQKNRVRKVAVTDEWSL